MMTVFQTYLRPYLWVLPFICFLGGYQLVRLVTYTPMLYTPSVLGLHVTDAIRLLSADQLNIRIIAEKEDPDLQEGMILSQTPEQGVPIKPHQSLFVVLTRRPLRPVAPKLRGVTAVQGRSMLKQLGIRMQAHEFHSGLPQGRIIAQSVLPGREIPEHMLRVYVSSGSSQLRIMPDVTGMPVDEVVSFFGLYDIPVHISGPHGKPIDEQRPVAGATLDLSRPLIVDVATRSS